MNMKIECPTLSYQNIDIAPEILYQIATKETSWNG